MIKIPQARIWKTGKGYVITIPKAFVKGEVLKEGGCYDVVVQDGKSNKAVASASDTSGLFSLVSPAARFAVFS